MYQGCKVVTLEAYLKNHIENSHLHIFNFSMCIVTQEKMMIT